MCYRNWECQPQTRVTHAHRDLALTCDLYKMCAILADCVHVVTPLLSGPTRCAHLASFLGMPFDVKNIPIHLQEVPKVGHPP